jgi:hypothetical protein
MSRNILIVAILILSGAWSLSAQPQQEESLADLARQVREQRDKDANKAAKVFTNDNLPAAKAGEPVNSGPPAPSTTLETASKSAAVAPPPSSQPTGSQSESPEDKSDDKLKTRDYWQEKFKSARRDLAKAKEAQELSDDELNLLQIQQVREIDPAIKADLTTKVQAKQSEVDVNKAATEAAQKDLDDLDKAFKESGAPDDWSKTD